VPALLSDPRRTAPEHHGLVSACSSFERRSGVSAMRLTACRCMMALASVNPRCFKAHQARTQLRHEYSAADPSPPEHDACSGGHGGCPRHDLLSGG
jgi:hypothetical protein